MLSQAPVIVTREILRIDVDNLVKLFSTFTILLQSAMDFVRYQNKDYFDIFSSIC
jgi:hypothetical protein